MGCGCGSAREKLMQEQIASKAEQFAPPVEPSGPAWLIVLCTRGGSGMSASLLERLVSVQSYMEETHNQPVKIVMIDTASPDIPFNLPKGIERVYISPASFSWPRAMNIGAAHYRTVKYLLFLHDDVSPPEGDTWLLDMQEALVGRVGMAVPHLSTGNTCPPQGTAPEHCHDLVSFEVTEYVAPPVLAVRREAFIGVGMFHDDMDGYEWSQVALQDNISQLGWSTHVVPGVTFKHQHRSTYSAEERLSGWDTNMMRYTEVSQQRAEYKRRPSRVRLPSWTPKSGLALLLVVENAASINSALFAITLARSDAREQELAEIVVVDYSPSESRRQAFLAIEAEDGGIIVRYAPVWDVDPIRQAVNLAISRDVKLYDMRIGSPVPCEPLSSRRIRAGWVWTLPELMEVAHLGCMQHAAVGDTVMMTPGIHAFRQAYPHVKIIVHHAWAAGEVLRYNPDIDELRIYNTDDPIVPPDTFDMMAGCGTEGCVRTIYANLGVDHLQEEPRRLRYFLQKAEHEEACQVMAELGLDNTHGRLIGVQMHGTWFAKEWDKIADLVRAIHERGDTPVVFGISPERSPAIDVPHIPITGQPLRIAAAVIGLLDCIVAFDSGLAWLAVALHTPVVSLWGPTNHRGYLLDVETVNVTCIRKRTPDDCKTKHGKSCREIYAGARCPLRQSRGADCIDEITVEEVLSHVDKMPFWGRPIAERWYERVEA